MKGRIRKKTGRILGGVFLFALVIGMLVVPYMTDGNGKVAKAGRTFESYFDEKPVPYTELVYNGQKQNLMKDIGKGQYDVSSIEWNVSDKDGGSVCSGWISKVGTLHGECTAKDAGEYTVKYNVAPSIPPAADDNLKNEYKITIVPASPKIETTPEAITGLTFNGESQNLISPGAVAEVLDPSVTSDPRPQQGTMMYSLDGGTYSKAIPTGTAVGTYTVWYKVEGYDKNYTDTTPASITATIDKAPQGPMTPPAIISGLKYDGTEKKLITPGQADTKKGTMVYSLDGTNFSSNIPTGKEAKTYTVWYKVEGNENYEDSATETIQVKIDKGSSTAGGGTTTGGGGGSSSSSSSSSSSTPSTTPAPQVPEKEDERGVHTVIKSSDGSVTDVWTKTEKDGSITEIRKTTHPDGTVTETETKISADRKNILKVVVIYDAQGRKIDTSIEFSQQKDSTLMSINLASLMSLLEKDASGKILGGAKVVLTLMDDDGTEKFTVTLDSSLLNEKELVIFEKDRDGSLIMVQNIFTCTITDDGEMSLNIPEKGNYQLVSTEEAKKLGVQITSSVKPLKKEASLKKGKSLRFKLSEDCNQKNILEITYKVKNNKAIKLKVNKKGKITVKKTSADSGTAIVTANVKLKNGTSKKVKMEISVE